MENQRPIELNKDSADDRTELITIENCDDEPIRIPGSIQRHGFLLLLDQSAGRVVAASENSSEFLQIPLNLLLGTRVEAIFQREILAVIRSLVNLEEVTGQVTYLGSFPMRTELYSVVTHAVNGQHVLEFERVEHLASPELMNAVVTNFVGKLSKLKSEMELCQAITHQVSALTGFNRVLLYSFDDAGHGTVLAEENDGTLPSYLDLRFPATDIPRQARELYLQNTIRIIPDATYIPSPLRGVANTPMRSFDLSSSILRSVSPIHLQYMRNMGTLSSMSISLVCEGRLWGLISCHHVEARSVAYVVRSACDLLSKMAGTQLMAFQTATQLERAVHFHGVQRRILTQMAAENDYLKAMSVQLNEVAQVTNADGVALVIDGGCESFGQAPPESDTLRLARELDSRADMKLFASRHLQEEFGWATALEHVASGLVAIRISDVRQSYVMWFRPQIVATVRWAGEPNKQEQASKSLHPRTSFEVWKEEVRGKSAPWTGMEIESAQEFRTAVMTISLKRAEEAIDVGEARFQELTHSLPNLVWVAGDDGELTYVNQRWKQEGLATQGKWFEQGRLFVEDRERCARLWGDTVRSGRAFETELRLMGEDDLKEHLTLVRALPFKKSSGHRAGWVGTFTDLTGRMERELAVRMTEKLALTGRMTSFIAHEINNPLEALANLHYLLERAVPGNGPALSYIATAQSELERISAITKQTLRWSKESNERPEQVSAGTMFEDAVRLFRGKISNRELSVTIAGQQHQFFAVAGQIRQVVVNLLSNALDAAPVSGWIRLEAALHGTQIHLKVSDNGPGMDEVTQKHHFQPFYSTKGDLGNGLGLYISHEIVERHGGKILVESRLGTGTTMTIQLPREQSN